MNDKDNQTIVDVGFELIDFTYEVECIGSQLEGLSEDLNDCISGKSESNLKEIQKEMAVLSECLFKLCDNIDATHSKIYKICNEKKLNKR